MGGIGPRPAQLKLLKILITAHQPALTSRHCAPPLPILSSRRCYENALCHTEPAKFEAAHGQLRSVLCQIDQLANKANKVCQTDPLASNACLFTYFNHACLIRMLEREEQVISGVWVCSSVPLHHKNLKPSQACSIATALCRMTCPIPSCRSGTGWGRPRCCCSLSWVVRVCLSSCRAICCCCCSLKLRAKTHQKHKTNIREHAHQNTGEFLHRR